MENGAKKHFVLVHGNCHGAWCWYKVATLLAAAGHRVTAPDLAASGADPRRLDEVETFSEYSGPLLEVMSALSPGERVVLVGHSFGGMSIALAADRFPEKVAAAVFISAFTPDTTSRPSYVVDEYVKKFPPPWADTQVFKLHTGSSSKPLTGFLFGPKFLSSRLYQLCSPEDKTLALSLVRVGSLFLDDLSGEPPFSEAGYGSVKKVFVICDQDLGMPSDFQQWMAGNFAMDEVKTVEGADHMVMMSKPRELCQSLQEVADTYA